MTVKELSEQYGTLDLLTAYIMRTANVSESIAEDIVVMFDMDTERHLLQILEDTVMESE